MQKTFVKYFSYFISIIMVLNPLVWAANDSSCLAPQKAALMQKTPSTLEDYFASLTFTAEQQKAINSIVRDLKKSDKTKEFHGNDEHIIAGIIDIFEQTEDKLKGSPAADDKILSDIVRFQANDDIKDMSLLTFIKKVKKDLKEGRVALRIFDTNASESIAELNLQKSGRKMLSALIFQNSENGTSYINIPKDIFNYIVNLRSKNQVSRILAQMIIQNIITKGDPLRISNAVLVERYFTDAGEERMLSDYHHILLEYYQKKFGNHIQYGKIIVDLANPNMNFQDDSAISRFAKELNDKSKELVAKKPGIIFRVMNSKYTKYIGGAFGVIGSFCFAAAYFFAAFFNQSYQIGIHPLSELGIGEVPWLFNYGSMIAGFFIAMFARLGLPTFFEKKIKKVFGVAMLFVSGIFLAMVGVFPKDIQPLHNVVAALFFITGGIGIGVSSATIFEKLKLKWPVLISAISFASSALIFVLTRSPFVETVATFLILSWFSFTGASLMYQNKPAKLRSSTVPLQEAEAVSANDDILLFKNKDIQCSVAA